VNLRLIKTGMSPTGGKHDKPPVDVPIIDTIQSWIHEFQATRANRARLDFERISNAGKTGSSISVDCFKVK
jgi:hypothetical protein